MLNVRAFIENVDSGNSPLFNAVAVAVVAAGTAAGVATGAFFRLAMDVFPMMITI